MDRQVSTVERVARHIEDRIIFGGLSPRERIQELRVAGELGVSRGSVREALLVLEGRHMVTIYPRRGALVSELNPGEMVAAAEVVAHVTGAAFAELAAVMPNAAISEAMQRGCAELEEATRGGDLRTLIQKRQAFLEIPLDHIDNEFVVKISRGLSGTTRRLMMLASRNAAFDPTDSRRCGQALFESTVARDGDRSRQILLAVLRRDGTLAQAAHTI